MSNSEFKSTLKSSDTEEHIDIYFYRPIGYQWARFFRMLHVTPNVVTILSIFLGVGAGICFGFNDLRINIVGILLLIWANMYDSCDGQLARLTNQKSALGRILDGAAGDFWFISIYVAICIRLMPEWGVWIWVLCVVSGFGCHSRQCRLADYYRQIHLYFLLGKKGSELDDSESQRTIYDSMPWKGNFWAKMFYINYSNYCRSQEKRTPEFQKLYKTVRQRWPNADDMPQPLRDEFRRLSLPLMKYTNLLTFNSRAILIYITCLANVPYVYPLVEMTVFVVMYRHMHSSHEAFCKKLNDKKNEHHSF